MVAINRIHVDPHDWPPETFDPPPEDDPIDISVYAVIGVGLVAWGMILGFSFHAGWELWEAVW